MANSPRFYTTGGIKGSVDNLAANCNSGFIKILSIAQPALDGAISGVIATLTFGATAFGNSTQAGTTVTATANAIGSDTNAAGGTAASFALVKSDNTTVVATGSVGTSAADLNLNSLAISAGATVSCSSFTITQAQQ